MSAWVIGQNVPWSVSWTAEQSFNITLSDDFPGHMDVIQAENPGVGEPKFATLHINRHRLGMGRHVCHVCGRPTVKGNRYIFPVQSGGFVTLPDESLRYAGNVPPVHLACAKRAQTMCPHLSGSYSLPVAYPAEDSRLMPRTDVVAGMEGFAKTLPPGLKTVFTCYRLFGPRFTKQVQKLREQYGSHAP